MSPPIVCILTIDARGGGREVAKKAAGWPSTDFPFDSAWIPTAANSEQGFSGVCVCPRHLPLTLAPGFYGEKKLQEEGGGGALDPPPPTQNGGGGSRRGGGGTDTSPPPPSLPNSGDCHFWTPKLGRGVCTLPGTH